MTSVSHSLPVDTIAFNGRRTPSRKAPSPYCGTSSAKGRFTKSPSKVSRNNTFIAPSQAERNGDEEELLNRTNVNFVEVTKVKCSSAGAVEDMREQRVKMVDIFKGADIQFSDNSRRVLVMVNIRDRTCKTYNSPWIWKAWTQQHQSSWSKSKGALPGLQCESEEPYFHTASMCHLPDSYHIIDNWHWNPGEFYVTDQVEEGSEENHQRTIKERSPTQDILPAALKQVSKRASAIPVKTKAPFGRPIRSQRSIISGSDSKTIKFLLKLTTKSYFETLKYEIDRIKENDRKVQDQASSHSYSIMALISKGAELDRKMEDLREQNARLLLETREKDKAQQETVNSITCELNELKSVCNLLLKNIEKDHELEVLARKLRKSKKFDSNTYKMLKNQLRKPVQFRTEGKKSAPKLVRKPSITSLPTMRRSEIVLEPKSNGSRRSLARQKSDWSSFSSMSSVSTGTDMLSDIEINSDKKSCNNESPRKSQRKLKEGGNAERKKTVKTHQSTKRNENKGQKSCLMKIFCCGGRSKVAKEVKID